MSTMHAAAIAEDPHLGDAIQRACARIAPTCAGENTGLRTCTSPGDERPAQVTGWVTPDGGGLVAVGRF